MLFHRSQQQRAVLLLTLVALILVDRSSFCHAFVIQSSLSASLPSQRLSDRVFIPTRNMSEDDTFDIDIDDDAEEDEGDELAAPPVPARTLDGMEQAWRYAKKPLLSIGAKGATLTHGNSLRQLLEQHTVVKVKVNTRRFHNSLQEAFEHLTELAQENGAPEGIELLQARDNDHVILFGWPGTRQRIQDGEFPPPPQKSKEE